jgi:hypothetical protein
MKQVRAELRSVVQISFFAADGVGQQKNRHFAAKMKFERQTCGREFG